MFYKARVISNNKFASTGKITVRVFKDSAADTWEDLSNIPDTIKQSLSLIKNAGKRYIKSKDSEAYVFSPFGGGFDYGMFMLPQPNSLGVVTEIQNENNEDLIEYIWLGAVSFSNDGSVMIPSRSEKDVNGINNGANISSRTGFVLKTKSTEYNSSADANIVNKLNFSRNAFTNLIVVDETETKIYHRNISKNPKNGTSRILSTSCFTLGENGIEGFVKPYTDGSEDLENYTSFELDSTGRINLKRLKKDQGTVTLKVDDYLGMDGQSDPVASITQEISTKNYSVTSMLTEKEITSSIDNNYITLKGGDEKSITIESAKKANINIVPGDESYLNLGRGAGGKSFVLYDYNSDLYGGNDGTLDIGGTTLTLSGSVKG